MYTRSAPYYDLLYGFKDYRAASDEIAAIIERHHPQARSLLDVACGTGRHLEYLSTRYRAEGLDLNRDLLEVASRRCPGAVFHQADMVDFEFEKKFDVVVCLFSAIAYVVTPERLKAAVRSMSNHLAPGGLILLEPWFSPDSFWTGTITANFVDEPETKIAWMYTSDEPEDDVAILHIQYLVGTPAGVEHFSERHEMGLFSDDQYRSALCAQGLSVTHDADGPFGRGLYVGSR